MATPPQAPETPDLTVAAAGQPLDLGSLTIHAAAVPYVTEWYNDTKRSGDTPLKFLRRMIYTAAVQHRYGKLVAANQGDAMDDPPTQTHASQHYAYQLAVGEELSALMAAIDALLG